MKDGLADSMVCRLRVPIPAEYGCVFGNLSLREPRPKVQVMAVMILEGDQMVEDVRVGGSGSRSDPFPLLDGSRHTQKLELLGSTPGSTVYRSSGKICPVISVFRKLGLLPNYPFSIENGAYNILVTGTHDQIRDLYSALREILPATTITGIHHMAIDGKEALLTPHQFEVFRVAMSSGYWDIPRRTNLTALAHLLNRAKSTLSETLAQIESKLLHEVKDLYLREMLF